MANVLFSALLCFALFAQSIPNFSGTWKLDRNLSTGQPDAKGASLLVITQSGDTLSFDYYRANNGERGDLIQSSSFTTDGRERRGNKARTYITYVKSYWQGKSLILQNKGIIDPGGEQTFTLEDRWVMSSDGKTLTDQSSDGTKTVFTRQPNAEP